MSSAPTSADAAVADERHRVEQIIAQAAGGLEDASPEDILRWAVKTFGDRICGTSSMTDAVIIHMASAIRPGTEVVSSTLAITFQRASAPGTRYRLYTGVQGAASPRPRVGGDLRGVQRDPADQQPGVRGPSLRAVAGHRDLRAFHADRVGPVVLGDACQQPPQRRDPLGADGERDLLVVGGASQLPGEIARIAAQRLPARSPGSLRQAGQGAAQQIRRGRPRVIGALAQVGGQADLGLGPAGHVRAAHPLAWWL